MALTERTIIDKYEIVGDFKHIQCRHATIIERDGLEISRSYHRHVIAPSDDVTGEPQEVQALVALMHTPEVIAAYEAHVASQGWDMSKARGIADSTKTISVDGGTIKLDGNYPVGTNNVALGDTALDSNVSGSGNTAIGTEALTANTASNNTAVGYQAGGAITTGSNNTLIGGHNGNGSNFDIRTSSGNIVLSDGAGGVHFASANGAAFITPMGDYTRRNHMVGKLAIANTANGTVDLVKVHEAGANNNVYFRVRVLVVAAIGRRGTYYEGYAAIDANGGAVPAVTVMAESGIPSGWSDAGNFTLSWNATSSPYTLRLTCNRSENYIASSIDVDHIQHDSYANIEYQSQNQSYL